MTSSPRQFEQTLDLQAPRDAVWKALTDADEMARWFAPRAEADLRVGGEMVWEWTDFYRWPQTIETLEPGSHLRTRYDSSVEDGEGGKRPLFVDYFLSGDGGTTTLRLVHSGFDEDARFDDEFDGISSGWPTELGSLRHYLENHRGKSRHVAWSHVALEMDADEAWATLTAPDAIGCGVAIADVEAGAAFSFSTADGDAFEGRVLRAGTREACGVATSHGDAFLRIWAGSCGGTVNVWTWLAMYGDDVADAARAQQTRWDAMLARIFAGKILENAPAGEGTA